MAFGPIMEFTVGELRIQLAPIEKEDMKAFISPGMQLASVTQFLGRHGSAPVLEDEYNWQDKIRQSKDNLIWGIWLVKKSWFLKKDKRILIGNTGLVSLSRKHVHQGESGSMIFVKKYWNKGIASAAHKARTWYAFQHMGLHRIGSGAIEQNIGSRTALGRSGYVETHIERNESFVDGELRNLVHMECLNPIDTFWNQWWHGDRPSAKHYEARVETQKALDWAKKHVKLL